MRRRYCNAICTNSATTLDGESSDATGGTSTYAANEADATNDATSAASVGTAWHDAADDAKAADANDDPAATNATRDADVAPSIIGHCS